MKFSHIYQSFYEDHLHKDEGNSVLKELIAQKTFKKKTAGITRFFAQAAFAVMACILAGWTLAPQAFAETVKFAQENIHRATDAITLMITRSFDEEQDIFSDEDITTLSEDPSISSLKYTRDENGEQIEWSQECNGEQECAMSLPSIEYQTEGAQRIHVEGNTSSEKDPEMTFTAE